MKTLIYILFGCFTVFSLRAQGYGSDEVKTIVDLGKFKLSKKIVQAEYGRVIMYFNQKDYLKIIVATDTVKITPKYFENNVIAKLLKKGKVKIIRRSDNATERNIIHFLDPPGGLRMRNFELSNGVHFFSQLEKIESRSFLRIPDYVKSSEVKAPMVINKFEYEDEQADMNDTSSVLIKTYFPLMSSTYYVYKNDNGYDELDTNVCKSRFFGKKRIYYFAECFYKNDLVSVGTTNFGPGIYFYQNDSLFTIEADYEKEISEKSSSSSAELFLPAYMRPGDSVFNKFRKRKANTHIFKKGRSRERQY